jgi:hypothetical protein
MRMPGESATGVWRSAIEDGVSPLPIGRDNVKYDESACEFSGEGLEGRGETGKDLVGEASSPSTVPFPSAAPAPAPAKTDLSPSTAPLSLLFEEDEVPILNRFFHFDPLPAL